MFSLVVPVYRNEDSIPELLVTLNKLYDSMEGDLEAVLVVDGSPDRSLDELARRLNDVRFPSQLLALSRNFGSFSAIRAGLAAGTGDLFGVMSADLQEPPELVMTFRERLLTGGSDVVVGTREVRDDPVLSRLFSFWFWRLYGALVQREVPACGVDVFACTREFRDHLLALEERNSTLVGLLFWLGFRRATVPYRRGARQHGRSAWSWGRRVRYLLDSCFAFSDLPIRMMTVVGAIGMTSAVVLGVLILIAKLSGRIAVPGYTATVLTVVFFGAINSLGLGLIGEYLWRTFENTKRRPLYLVASRRFFGQQGAGG